MRLRHSMPVPTSQADPPLAGGVSLESWLAEVSDHAPLLIEVDNAEYADASSLGVLASLARGSRDRRLLLVVTQKLGAAERGSVGLTALSPHCDHMTLAAFSAAETQELARSLFGEAQNLARFGEFLYARTAGNPMHCIEVARQLIAARAIRYLDGNWALPAERPNVALPTALEGALSARLAALSAPARRLAECLSLHRGETTLELCRNLMGRDRDRELFALQDELSRNDVFHADEGGFRFSSTALQETLLSEMDDAGREQGHRRLGEALLQLANAKQHALRIQAGWHLLQGGDATRGADLIAEVTYDSVAVRLVFTALHGAGAAIEAALEVYRKQRRPRLQRLPLLAALAQAGYYEDRRFGELYGDEALDMLEDVSGLRAAKQLSRYVGRHLGLVFGLGFGFFRFMVAPRSDRGYSFGEVMIQLFGVVATLTGLASICLDAARAKVVTEILRPFDVLPDRLTPVGILEFSEGLQQIGLENQAEATMKFERLLARLDDPRCYPTLRGDARKIIVAGVHFARAVFATYRNDSSSALESADALDALDLKFYAMIASQMRFLYHMNRGDFRTAQQHRQQVDIHAAHVGSAWQVEMWEPAALIPVYTLLLDVDGMARVADRLELLARSVPSMRTFARLARHAQGLVLSDATYGANAVAIEMLERATPRSYIGWTAHVGFTAQGSRFLGNYDVAKRLCDLVARNQTEADRDFVVLHLVADIERAWCEASEGRPDRALAALDALLARHMPSDHPLVHGLIHEARALIAHRASLPSELEQSAAEVERWLRPTGNPALIAKCERIAALRTQDRPGSGRRTTAEVNHWLHLLAGYEDAEQRVTHALELLRRTTDAKGAAWYRRHGDALVLSAQTSGAAFPEGEPQELQDALERFEREPSTERDAGTATVQRTASVHVDLDPHGSEHERQAYLLIDGSGAVIGAVALSLRQSSSAPPRSLLGALAEALSWDDATVAEPTRSVVPKRVRAST
ncbi:MAG: hypothetical protein ACHQ53_03425, partial [Polyangiales bacterium]